MNTKWILVLFVGMFMVLHISNAEIYDELLRQDAEFENRQPQKRSESLNFRLISSDFLKLCCAGIWLDFLKIPEENYILHHYQRRN